jgi:hypothetical protein
MDGMSTASCKEKDLVVAVIFLTGTYAILIGQFFI